MTSNIAECLYLSSYGPVMVSVTSPTAVARDAKDQPNMGKAPGVLRNGKAVPVAVAALSCKTLAQAREIDRWGFNVGLACGRDLGDGTALFAYDADIDDATVAALMLRELREACAMLGEPVPVRRVNAANWPRFLFVVRLRISEVSAGYKATFRHPDGRTLKTAVDGLWSGRQFVAAGTHQTTLAPITWVPALPPAGPLAIPLWSVATFDAVKAGLERHLSAAGYVSTAATTTSLSGAQNGSRSTVTCSEAEARALMALIPNTDDVHKFDARDQWQGVGHALYNASGGAQWGLDLWLEFNGQRGQTVDCATFWDQFGKAGHKNAGYATLAQYAAKVSGPGKTAGVLMPDASIDPEDAAALAAKDAETRAQQEASWRKITSQWVYITGERGFANLHDPEAATVAPNDMAARFKPALPALRRNLIERKLYGPKDRPSFGDCFPHAPGATILEQRAYFPGEPRIFRHPDRASARWLNTWTAPEFGAAAVPKSRIRPWLEFSRYVWGSSWACEMFQAYCALMLQDWSTRPAWAPLLRTRPGVGKNLMIAPLLEALGDRHVAQPEMSALIGRFKTHLQARLVLVSETHALHGHGHTGRHDMNALKEQIAGAKMIEVDRKGRDTVRVRALACFVFFANDDDAFALAEDDRRIWAVANDAAPRDPAFYRDMAAWNADPANCAALGQYHARLQLPDAVRALLFAPAPTTRAKQELIAMTADPVTTALAELIEDVRTAGDARMVQTPAQIVAALLDGRALSARDKAAVCTGMRFNKRLLAAGARPVSASPDGASAMPVHVPGSARSARLWLLAPSDLQGRDWAGLSSVEMAAASLDGWPRKGGTTATVTELPTRPAKPADNSTDDAEIV